MMHDAIIIGGGLAGASLGINLAKAGKTVLMLEREVAFKDRVRGEFMCPWGVAEARSLGLYDLLVEQCAHEAPVLHFHIAGAPLQPSRDLVATTPHKAGALHFQHREMQETLIRAAEAVGVEVRRGVRLTTASGGERPEVTFADGEKSATASARLLVGADGRNSIIRSQCGFDVNKGPDKMVMAGVLFDGVRAPDDGGAILQNLATGQFAGLVPLRNGLFRSYYAHHKGSAMGAMRLSGHKDLQQFIDASVQTGAPSAWFGSVKPMGPLASFDCADTWADRAYRDGIALVGDAAASSDPTHGCGLSLTLRSVRTLRDCLAETDDWKQAGEDYATVHARDAAALRTITEWLTQLWYEPGEEAAQARARAMPLIADDPSRVPDFVGLGPDSQCDETARMRLFGEV